MKRTGTLTVLLYFIIIFITSSCTSVFPNDQLDYMWRLDKIYDINSKEEKEIEHVWFCFARDLIEICDNTPHGPVGVISDYGDSLKIDYSMYTESTTYDTTSLLKILRECGISSLTTTFIIEKLDSGKMILADKDFRLYLTRW